MTQSKTHNVKQKDAVPFLNNLLDMVLTGGGPKGFADVAAEKIRLALKENNLCSEIMHGNQDNFALAYTDEESLFLTSLEKHLVCLHKKPQYTQALDAIGYKKIIPANAKPCDIKVTSGLFGFAPDGDVVDQKLQLFCNNIEAHGGKIDLPSLQASAKELMLSKSQNTIHKKGLLGLLIPKWA